MLAAAMGSVGLVIPYLKEPRVRKLVAKYADDRAIPSALRAQFNIWLGFKAKNLIENGSFELDKPAFSRQSSRKGSRDDRHASDGKYSFRIGNGYCYYSINVKMEPGKKYLFLCDVYIEKGSSEGRFSYRLGPSIGMEPRNWFNVNGRIPSGGTWNTYSTIVSHPPRKGRNVDTLQIQMWFEKFEQNEPVWLDNIRLYCLDDFETGKTAGKK